MHRRKCVKYGPENSSVQGQSYIRRDEKVTSVGLY
jgi:hypothetical protein